MLIRVLLILFSICTFTSTANAASLWEKVQSFLSKDQPKKPSIKVLVVHDADGVILEVKGKYNIYDPFTNERLGTRFVGKGNLIQAMQGGLKWGEEFPGIYQILIIPDDPKTTTIVDGIEYRGSVYVYDVKGHISVVNEVDLEDYVNSILSLEFKEPRSSEAMAAVAIIERTNALHQVSTAKNPYWHVRAKDVDYYGYAVTGRANGVDQAIASTRYMILSRTNNDSLAPFSAAWIFQSQEQVPKRKSFPGLSFEDAEALALKGSHAADILSKAYPNTVIRLTYNRAAGVNQEGTR